MTALDSLRRKELDIGQVEPFDSGHTHSRSIAYDRMQLVQPCTQSLAVILPVAAACRVEEESCVH